MLEAALTFVLVYAMAAAFGMPVVAALLLASLAMSTSPAGVLRVVNEQRSGRAVTERVLHLTALNCVLSVFVFKVLVGFWVFETSGSLWRAVSSSLIVLSPCRSPRRGVRRRRSGHAAPPGPHDARRDAGVRDRRHRCLSRSRTRSGSRWSWPR